MEGQQQLLVDVRQSAISPGPRVDTGARERSSCACRRAVEGRKSEDRANLIGEEWVEGSTTVLDVK